MSRHGHATWTVATLILVLGTACGDSETPAAPAATLNALKNRAYIVSELSEELTIIDLDKLEILRRVPTGGMQNHMAELNADFSKIFVDSSANNESIVIDATTFKIENRIKIKGHPTHITLTPDGNMFAIMAEETNQVVFVDPHTQKIVKQLDGFSTPHFMRYAKDGNFGYVANIGGNRVTRVDMQKLSIVDEISLDGFENQATVQDEGGFADAQIASDGMLYAAHRATGRVLTYDTNKVKKTPEIPVGSEPWIVFAEHPYEGIALHHVVPNFGDKTVSVIDAERVLAGVSATLPGDEEAYGVNFSPLEPNLAFVMNRVRQDIAVVDTAKGEILERIDVGGNTETASTTADGKLIVAAVSSANRVVVIDVATRSIKKIFENVGRYPWSVTIPSGQNYCH
jgi:DNA-binding beta-propeller fold protein YncE